MKKITLRLAGVLLAGLFCVPVWAQTILTATVPALALGSYSAQQPNGSGLVVGSINANGTFRTIINGANQYLMVVYPAANSGYSTYTVGIDTSRGGTIDVTSQLTNSLPAQVVSVPCSQILSVSSTVWGCYPFVDGAGATLSDFSGHSGNGPINNSPTWQGNGANHGTGILFNPSSQSQAQSVSLPSYLNASLTIHIFGTVTAPDTYEALIGSTVAMQFGILTNTIASVGTPWGQNLASYSSYTFNAATVQPFAGNQLVTVAMAPGGDLVYLDGVTSAWLPNPPGSSAGTTTTGNFQLAGTSAGGFAPPDTHLHGVLNFAVFDSAVETPDQISRINAIIRSYENSLLNVTAAQNTMTADLILPSGNSLMAGYLSGTPPSNYIVTNSAYSLINYALAGQNSQEMLQREAQNAAFASNGNTKNIEIYLELRNCMVATSNNSSYCYSQLKQYCTAAHQPLNGAIPRKVLVLTTSDDLGTPGMGNAGKNAINALVRKRGSMDCDGVIDIAQFAALGGDDAANNGTNFFSDKIHWQTVMDQFAGAAISGVINSLDGATLGNPNSTSTATLALTSADNFLIDTVGGTKTLPSCYTVLLGAIYTVTNTAASTATTFAAFSGQTLVGSTSLAAGGTARFQEQFAGTQASPSCVFQRIQ